MRPPTLYVLLALVAIAGALLDRPSSAHADSAGAAGDQPCCAPAEWSAGHSATLVNAPSPEPLGSSSALGALFHSDSRKAIAYVDPLVYFANRTDQGVLQGPFSVRVWLLFGEGVAATEVNGECFAARGVISASMFLPSCWNTVDAPVISSAVSGASWNTSTAVQTLSNPGHFTAKYYTTYDPASCYPLTRRLENLNGNLAMHNIYSQALWNIAPGELDASHFQLPAGCQNVTTLPAGLPIHPAMSALLAL